MTNLAAKKQIFLFFCVRIGDQSQSGAWEDTHRWSPLLDLRAKRTHCGCCLSIKSNPSLKHLFHIWACAKSTLCSIKAILKVEKYPIWNPGNKSSWRCLWFETGWNPAFVHYKEHKRTCWQWLKTRSKTPIFLFNSLKSAYVKKLWMVLRFEQLSDWLLALD